MGDFDKIMNDVFGPGGTLDKVFGSVAPVKPTAIPATTGTISSLSDLRNFEFMLSEDRTNVLVHCIGTVTLIDHMTNKPINYRNAWLALRESRLKPKTGFAFELAAPNNLKVSTYIGLAKSGDHNVLNTFLHMKACLKEK